MGEANRHLAVAGICGLALLGAGLATEAEELQIIDPWPAARVNGVAISSKRLDSTFEAYVAHRGIHIANIRHPSQFKALKREALEILISQELLWQEALRTGAVASDEAVERARQAFIETLPSKADYPARIGQMGFTEQGYAEDLRRRLSVNRLMTVEIPKAVSVSDEEIHAAYVENLDRFRRPEQVRARHILIRLGPDADPATRRSARQRIEEVLAKARGGADFSALARRHSQDPSAAEGGDLGFFARGQTLAGFERAAFALQAGEISEVVETPLGYHIIKLEARRPAGALAEAAVHDRLREEILAEKLEAATEAHIEALREQARVEILIRL